MAECVIKYRMKTSGNTVEKQRNKEKKRGRVGRDRLLEEAKNTLLTKTSYL